MVGNGNHPLNPSHVDEDTLQEYVLGQLLPDQEEQIRQHIAACPVCRAAAADIQLFCRRVSLDLHKELDSTAPGPQLSFERIAPEWRKPPRRVALMFRAQRLVPGASLALLLALFVTAVLVLFPSDDAAALRSLDLIDDYDGPPAVIAASTEHGLVVVRLSAGGSEVVSYLPEIYDPRHLQFSPDGRWLAYQQGRTLYARDLHAGGSSIRFQVHETAEWAWSPDGQMLAYTDGNGQLVVFDTLAQTSRVLVPADESAWGAPVWTADSTQIAYAVVKPLPSADRPYTRQGIWRVTVATGYRVELARNPAAGETLLIPAAWGRADTVLLAWDVSAGADGLPPTLYRVDVTAHNLEPLEGYSAAQGTRLAWPVGPQGTALISRQDHLVALQLDETLSETVLPDSIPWPQALEWAPNGAWFAYTVAGAAGGEGAYLFALEEGELRPIELPGGAAEKAVVWAGAEHLFVIRQPEATSLSELWMVPLTTGEPPQRVMTNMQLPTTGPYNGWRWHDILAAQVIAP